MVNRQGSFCVGAAAGYRRPCYDAPVTPAAAECAMLELSTVFVRVQWEQGADGEAAGCVYESQAARGRPAPSAILIRQREDVGADE